MDERTALIEAMAGAKPTARKRVKDAIDRIIDIVWDQRSSEFSFAGNPDIDAEVNAILAAMSDGNKADAEQAALRLLEMLELAEWYDAAVEDAGRERWSQDAIFRLDMHASHLKELLEGWIIVAAASGLSQVALKTEIWKHIGNPFASELWRNAGLGPLSWGKGYARNVLEGISVIMQDLINATYQYAKVQSFRDMGAIGYRTVRNSNYDCPFCDEMAKRIWPLDEVVLPYHPRCVCIPVPVFENETL